MRIRMLLASLLLVSSCSVSHKMSIKKLPCLYPFVNFDFTLCENFKYSVDGISFTVPMGFTTNLASIPRILWSLYSPNKANTIPAAVIHDYLYFCPGEMTRQEADSIFYDTLLLRHVSERTAFKYWLAVRIFGGINFNEGAFCTINIASIKNTSGQRRDFG